MKYGKVLAIAGIVVIAAGAAWAQDGGFGISLKPGMIINGAHFGYKSDAYFAGVGLEFASVGLTNKSTERDSWSGQWQEHTYTTKTDVSVFLPQVAARAYFGSAGENEGGGGFARPYVWLSAFYSIATAKMTSSNGDTTVRDTSSERQIKDLLGGNLGGSVAVGGEYFFNRSLSITGEFGCRMLFGGTKTKYESESYSYVTASSLGLGVTYTTLGLNFYF